MEQKQYIEIRNTLRDIIKGTQWEGHVFVVGGCVRDEIMGLEIKDIDMVIDMPNGGIRFVQWMHDNGYTMHAPVVYEGFGTAMFQLKEFPQVELECVQTRKEKYPDRSSRNPEVVHGTIEDDSLRRDLTINSLDINISTGALVDVTGHGMDDIKNHVIRTPLDPDITYDDDPLRILRCIRFASRYGWDIAPETYEGMKRNAHRLEIISQERKRDELDKMLTCKHPVMAMELMRDTGAMHYVIPELEEAYAMTQNSYHSGTVWQHTMQVLDALETVDLALRMAALLHDVGKVVTRTETAEGKVHFIGHETESARMAEAILRRLKYPLDFMHKVRFLVKHHMTTKQWGDDLSGMKDKHLRKLQYLCKTEERFHDLMQLIDADNKSHAPEHRMPRQAQLIMQRTREMQQEGSALFGFKLPLTGEEIMQLKGLPPGPAVKECKEHLLKLAYVTPLRDKETWAKYLMGYKPKCQS